MTLLKVLNQVTILSEKAKYNCQRSSNKKI